MKKYSYNSGKGKDTMKKSYQTVTIIKMIQQKEGEIVVLCGLVIDRAKESGQNITPFLQSEIRVANKKLCADADCLLNKGYQGWKDTEFDNYYRQVNTTQARCRQIAAAAAAAALTDDEKKAAATKKAAAKKTTPAEKTAADIGKEKMKTAAQKKRAESWTDKAKTARVALKTVQESSKKQLLAIADLKKKVAKLEKENNRMKREMVGHKGVYTELLSRVKAAKTLKDFQGILSQSIIN